MPRITQPVEHLGQLVVDGVLQVDPVGERASRTRAWASASVSRSSPISTVSGCAASTASACPARPSVASTWTVAAAPAQRGGQQLEAPLEQHRHVRAA